MNGSQKAYDLIQYFEKLRLRSYRDAVGVWTIGFGHTRRVGPGMVITEDEAWSLFLDDIREHEFELNKLLTIDLLEHQYDALLSWIFNVGGDKARKSTLIRKVNEEAPKASQQFLRWTKGRVPGKQTLVDLPGLVKRRNVEKHLFDTGQLLLEEWPHVKV